MIPMRVSHSVTTSVVPLYRGDRIERDLVVVVDADTVVGDARGITRNDLLLGLATHEHIDLYRYADGGPPSETPLLEPENWRSAPIGWLLLETADPDSLASHSVIYSDGHRISETAIFDGLVDRYARSVGKASCGDSADQIERAALILAAANSMGADILVTAREALLSGRPFEITDGLTVASPSEAIPLLALSIRSRGEYFATKSAQFAATFNKGLYLQRSLQVFLPKLADVSVRVNQLGQARQIAALGLLAGALQRRLARVLERRDAMWRLINQSQDYDVSEDTLAEIDSLLTFLMSAWDALAKTTNCVLEMDTKPRNVGWQKTDWLKALSTRDPGLSAMFSPPAQPARALEILRLLRNCIHDEGLDAVMVQTSSRTRATWIVLPAWQVSQITAAMEAIKPLGKWGIRHGSRGPRYAEAGPLIEALLLESLTALNTVTGRLNEILTPITAAPDWGPPSTAYEALLSLHIQWQMGLGDA